jgi:ABC-type antimicrobial peptide transport system permease subunit
MKSRDEAIQKLQGDAQIAFAQDALRGIVILNGGAVLALLTFVGQIISKNENYGNLVIFSLKKAFIFFIAGVVCGITAQGCAYLSQQAFVEERQNFGRSLRHICIAASISGIFLFAYGSFATISGMLSR